MEQILKLFDSNPEGAVLLMKGYIEKYKPSVYSLLKELLEIYKDFSENKEVAKIAAQVKKNLFDAYIEAGFNEEQAVAFIINDMNLMRTIERNGTKR